MERELPTDYVLKAKIYSQGKITLGKKLMEHFDLKEGDEILLSIKDIINASQEIERIPFDMELLEAQDISMGKKSGGFKIKEKSIDTKTKEYSTEIKGKVVRRTLYFK